MNYPDEINENVDKNIDAFGYDDEDDPRQLGLNTSSPEYYKANTNSALEEPDLAVSISERASYLTEALADYAHASQLGGYANKLEEEKDYEGLKKNSANQKESMLRGNYNFAKALGSLALILDGFDPYEVDKYERIASKEFRDKYIGKVNEKNREKYRRVLKKQTENF